MGQPVVPLSPLANVAFKLAVILLFLVESRFSDFVGSYLGTSGSAVRVISILAILVVAAAGGLPRALTSMPGLLLTAFTFWCFLSLPFSVWRGGSAELLKEVWVKSYLFFFIAAGALVTLDYCRKAMIAIGLAGGVVMVMTLVTGDMTSGRLSLEEGAIGNSNDLAAYFLTTLPFFVMIAMTAERSWMRSAGAIGAVLALILTLKTGSRSGVITTGFLIVIFFLKLSFNNRIKLLLFGVPTLLVAVMLAPETAIGRYRTLFSDDTDTSDQTVAEQVEMAKGSSEGRWSLFMLSLDITLHHPILGVGPGMFGVATSEDEVNRTSKLAFRETHVTYTQLSSETGIPGMLFYVGALFYCLRVTNRLYRQGRFSKDIAVKRTANMAMCLNLSLAVFAVFACFGSIAYTFTFPVLAGLTVAFERSALPVLSGASPSPYKIPLRKVGSPLPIRS
jgi:hypothetical protein